MDTPHTPNGSARRTFASAPSKAHRGVLSSSGQLFTALSGAIVGVVLSPLGAATVTWDGDTDANIATSDNWSGPIAAGDLLSFGAAGPFGTALNWDLATAVNLKFETTAGSYTFSSSGTTLAWGVNGTPYALINDSSNTQTFDLAITANGSRRLTSNAGSFVFNGAISVAGGGDLNISGAGGVLLAGAVTTSNHSLFVSGKGVANGSGLLTISGATTIAGTSSGRGVLRVGNNDGSGTLIVESGGVLTIAGTTDSTVANSIIGDSAKTGTVTVLGGGALELSASSGLVLGDRTGSSGGGGTAVLNINASGRVTITKGTYSNGADVDTGVIMMGKDSTTSSGTINLEGTLETDRQFTAGRGNSSNANIGNAYFNFDGGTLRALGDQSDWFSSGAYAVTATIKSRGAVVDTGSFNVTINSALLDGDGGGGLTKQGSGTLTLGGANTYTGATAITGGSLALDADATLASTSVSIAAGATLDVSAKNGYDLTGISTTIYLSEVAAGFIEAGGGSALTLGSSALTLNFDSSDLGVGASYDLFNAGSTSGNFGSVSIAGSFSTSLVRTGNTWTGVSGLYAFNFDQSTGDLSVTASAIPEPSTYAAIAGAFVLGAVAWRRRKSRV